MNKFGDTIRKRREEKYLLLRQVAPELEMDTAMLSKVERGERNLKREHVIKIAKILDLNEKDLLKLWLADKVYEVVKDEEEGLNAMKVAEKELQYSIKKRL